MTRRTLALCLVVLSLAVAAACLLPTSSAGTQLAGRGWLDPLGAPLAGAQLAGRGWLDPLGAGTRLAGRGWLDPLGAAPRVA